MTNFTTVTYDPTTNSVTCGTHHLSTFSIVAVEAPAPSSFNKRRELWLIVAIAVALVVVTVVLLWKLAQYKKNQLLLSKAGGIDDISSELEERYLPAEAAQVHVTERANWWIDADRGDDEADNTSLL